MRKCALLLVLLAILISCGVKQTQSMLTAGDYDGAIDQAVAGLRKNKDKKSKQEYVYLLQEAYEKARERDLRQIDLLTKDASPRNFEEIFSLYVRLNSRQEIIRPLLPLKLLNEGKTAEFKFDDYSEQIVNSKNTLAKYLYDNSRALLLTSDKKSHRRAYDDLVYLEQIKPDYKDIRSLQQEARLKGTDFVSVYTKNDTRLAIPTRLEDDLLDFSTYGLNDKWTVYHSNRQQGINYNYGVIINFREIDISPEKVVNRSFDAEQEIIDGKKKLIDRRGQVVLDSLGKPIMVDNIIRVRAVVTEYTQEKATHVAAKVDFIDFQNNQLLQSFPVASEFYFRNVFAKCRGDRRAVVAEYQPMFNQRPLPFPTNEQMVYDTGEDLKAKIKNIITKNPLAH
jgi:hypothetical protein